MKSKVVMFFMVFAMALTVVLTPVRGRCQTINVTGPDSNEGGTGGVMSHSPENTVVSSLQREAVGGAAGALIGKQMDKLAAELKANLKGAKVVRVGEGVIITFDSGPLFEHDSFELRATRNLKGLGKALNRYNYTNAIIGGHTDNTGEQLYNQSLSAKRAQAVEDYLMQHGVKDARIIPRGFGESQPFTSNNTEAGKQANRRMEIAIYADNDMKYLARKGELSEYIASKN